jgi:hypothetical protein
MRPCVPESVNHMVPKNRAMVKDLLRRWSVVAALFVICSNTSDAAVKGEGHIFFYGRIFKNQQEIWDNKLMLELNKLPLDRLRYLEENRPARIVNEQKETIYALELTSLQELKAEFDRVIPGVYATPETDKRTITIVQKADGQLFLDIR